MVFVRPGVSIRGALEVPGDKSISHRTLLLGAIADGESAITGFGSSADTLATAAALRQLGVGIEIEGHRVNVDGVGLRGLVEPSDTIDCGNAGTLMRLLAGILAGQQGSFVLTGDESLSRRPLERIAEPLRQMGARIETTDGHAPLSLQGGRLDPIRYELPVASAQVKSCILLAGLYATSGPTVVIERVPTRNHTERLLEAAGARIRSGPAKSVWPADRLQPLLMEIPGDFSSAAPFIAAATLLPDSQLVVRGVGVNPTRTGFLSVLERMGARIAVFNRRLQGGEPVADLEVEHAELDATEVRPEEVPLLVDELPLFALVAGMAHGESVVRGAEELRVKESDRLESVREALRPLGIRIETMQDGLRVRGVPTRPKGGGAIDAHGDHRIAMLGAVAGLVSRGGAEVEGSESVAVSFPDFFEILDSLAVR